MKRRFALFEEDMQKCLYFPCQKNAILAIIVI